MAEADTLDDDVHALKEWITAAWRRLGDPSLTRFERSELRNQMKQNDAELRVYIRKVVERDQRREQQRQDDARTFGKPDFRFLDL